MGNSVQQRLTIPGFLIAFIGAILFSTKAVIVKKAFADVHVDALSLLALRMLFSLPFYAIAALVIFKNSSNKRMTAKEWLIVIVLGLFGHYLSSLFDFMGLQYISAGLERLILFLYPSFAVFINALVFKESIKKNEIIALILTYIGIGIAYYCEVHIDTHTSHFFIGSFFAFLCAITYSIYIAGSGRIIPKVGANKFTSYALLASSTGVLLHYVLKGGSPAFIMEAPLWHYGLLLAIVATVIPTFLLSAALKQIGANNVAILSSIGPVSTILQAHYILGEEIFALQLIGTALVLAGVLLLVLKK